MIITQPLEITTPQGCATGRWRLVELSDEHDGAEPLCTCGGAASDNPSTCGHASPSEASECPVASEKVRARRGASVPSTSQPSLGDLAKLAFEAYGESTGGKTWDGKPIPPFEVVRERTPHVARAWEAAVDAVLKAVRS